MSTSNRLPTEVTNQFTIHKKLGSGSYGDVWLAESKRIGLFALKIIARSSFEDTRPFDRELRGLQYFVPVSEKDKGHLKIHFAEATADNEFLYYGMELADNIDGAPPKTGEEYIPKTLKEALNSSQNLSPKTIHQYLKQIAEALSHLHQNTLIHRDIKPSNIIFVNGRPKLADIGLVTTLDITFTSDLGTRGYMPPDEKSSPLSDIYSLGRVLYELLFGLPVTEYPRIPEHTLNAPNSGSILELNEIVIKCCQTDPKKRYQTVEEILKDLHIIESGRSLRKVNQIKARTHKLLRAAPAVLISTILLATLASWLYTRSRNAADTELLSLETRIEERIQNHWTGQHFQSQLELEAFSKKRKSRRHQATLKRLEGLIQDLPDLIYDPTNAIPLPETVQSLTEPLHPQTPILAGQTHNDQPILIDLNQRRSWIPPSDSDASLTATWLNSNLDTLYTARRTHFGTTTLYRQRIDQNSAPEIVLTDPEWFLTGVSIPNEPDTHLITTPAGSTFKIHAGEAYPKASIPPSHLGLVHFTPEHTLLHPTEPHYALWSPSHPDVRVLNIEHWEMSPHQFHHETPIEDLTWCPVAPIFATVTKGNQIYLWDATTGEKLLRTPNPNTSATQVSFSVDPTILVTSSPTHGVAMHQTDLHAATDGIRAKQISNILPTGPRTEEHRILAAHSKIVDGKLLRLSIKEPLDFKHIDNMLNISDFPGFKLVTTGDSFWIQNPTNLLLSRYQFSRKIELATTHPERSGVLLYCKPDILFLPIRTVRHQLGRQTTLIGPGLPLNLFPLNANGIDSIEGSVAAISTSNGTTFLKTPETFGSTAATSQINSRPAPTSDDKTPPETQFDTKSNKALNTTHLVSFQPTIANPFYSTLDRVMSAKEQLRRFPNDKTSQMIYAFRLETSGDCTNALKHYLRIIHHERGEPEIYNILANEQLHYLDFTSTPPPVPLHSSIAHSTTHKATEQFRRFQYLATIGFLDYRMITPESASHKYFSSAALPGLANACNLVWLSLKATSPSSKESDIVLFQRRLRETNWSREQSTYWPLIWQAIHGTTTQPKPTRIN